MQCTATYVLALLLVSESESCFSWPWFLLLLRRVAGPEGLGPAVFAPAVFAAAVPTQQKHSKEHNEAIRVQDSTNRQIQVTETDQTPKTLVRHGTLA